MGSDNTPATAALDGFDAHAVLARLRGDHHLLAEIIEMFLLDHCQVMADVRAAVAHGDAEALSRAAHRLRGGIGNFSLSRGYELATNLEMIARQQRLEQASRLLAELEPKVENLVASLRHYVTRIAPQTAGGCR